MLYSKSADWSPIPQFIEVDYIFADTSSAAGTDSVANGDTDARDTIVVYVDIDAIFALGPAILRA